MKTKSMILLGIAMSLMLSCNNSNKDEVIAKNDTSLASLDSSIDRGKYLVALMDCNTCHTPNIMTNQGPRPDMSRMLSGYPSIRPQPEFDGNIVSKGALFPHPDLTSAMGPWGVSFAGNLTPHDTGIGSWSLEQFSNAIRNGKFKGMEQSRPLLPPMPRYDKLTDNDLKAIYDYLMSIPAIDNIVPSHVPPKMK